MNAIQLHTEPCKSTRNNIFKLSKQEKKNKKKKRETLKPEKKKEERILGGKKTRKKPSIKWPEIKLIKKTKKH